MATRTELFLDTVNQDSQSGLSFVVNTPTKYDPHGTGYVVRFDSGYNMEIYFGTILTHDDFAASSKYRAFVSLRENTSSPYNWSGGRVGYMYSADLENWTLPNLGLVTIDGNTNNCALTGETNYHVSAVYLPDASSDMRYVLQLGEFTGTDAPGNIRLFKMAEFAGDYPTAGLTGFKTISQQSPIWDPGMSLVQRSDGKWISAFQRRNYPGAPNSDNTDVRDIEAYLSDTTGVAGLSSTWTAKGVIMNGVDYNDQNYSTQMNLVDGYLLSLTVQHDQQTGLMQSDLWVARGDDGITDQVRKKEAFIPAGSSGSWDDGMQFGFQGIFKVGNEWIIPYSGYDKPHPSDDNPAAGIPPAKGGLGLTKIGYRRIGSIERQSAGEGYFISDAITLEGKLYINCDATGGKIEVELLDATTNQPILGYKQTDCDDITTDTYSTEITWRGKSALVQKSVKIKFYLNYTSSTVKLYSYEASSTTDVALTKAYDVTYSSSIDVAENALKMDVCYPTGETNLPIIVLGHAWNGTKDTVPPEIAERWAKQGLFVVTPSFRQPNDAGAREIYDIYDAVEYVKTNYSAQVNANNVNYTGYSGGGGDGYACVVKLPDYFGNITIYFGPNDYGVDATGGWYQTTYSALASSIATLIGDTPTNVPDKYQARYHLSGLKNNPNSRIRIYHDENDYVFEGSSAVDVVMAQNWATEQTAQGYSNSIIDISTSADPADERYNHGYAMYGPNSLGEEQSGNIAPESVWIPEILAGTYANPSIATSSTFMICGFIKTKNFQVFLGDAKSDRASLVYDISKDMQGSNNQRTFTITNDVTANTVTTTFEMYNLTPSTSYTVTCTNVTDDTVVSSQDIATDANGLLTFDDSMVASKVFTWGVYEAGTINADTWHSGILINVGSGVALATKL